MSNTKYLVIFIFLFWHLSFAKCIFPVETLRWRPRTSDELFANLKSKSGNTIYYVFYEIKYRLEAEYAQTIKSEQEKSVISDVMKKCTELLQEPSLDSVLVNSKTDNNFNDIDILQGDTLFTASCSDVAILPRDTLMIALNIVSVGYAYGNKTAVDFVNNYLADYIANSKSEYLKLIWKNSFRIETYDKQKFDGYLELKNNPDYEYLKNRLVEIMRNRLCFTSEKAYGFVYYLCFSDEHESFWKWLKSDIESTRCILQSIENNFCDETPDYAYEMQTVLKNIYSDLASESEIKRFYKALSDNPKVKHRLRSWLKRRSESNHDGEGDDND